MRARRTNQRGMALLMAMLVVALASVTAVTLMHEQTLSVRRTGNIRNYDTSMMYGLALEDIAKLSLRRDFTQSKIDALTEDWANEVGFFSPIEGGSLSGTVRDEQAKINLNGVLDKETEDRLRTLCNNLDVSTEFIDALKDWVDKDLETVSPDGAEDDYYTALESPYRTANRPMTDISELLLVRAVNNKIYQALIPYVTVLPGKTSLNINTMPEQVYLTLDQNLDGKKFTKEREIKPFSSLQDYKKRMNHTLPSKGISVKTEYFKASGQVMLGDNVLHITTLIHRDSKGVISIVKRKLGAFS